MMESSRRIAMTMIIVTTIVRGSMADTRYYVRMRTNSSNPFEMAELESARTQGNGTTTANGSIRGTSQDAKSRSTYRTNDETMIRESLKANHERRNSFVESSTFDPDVLNKFLDDYANKIKTTTTKNYEFPFVDERPIDRPIVEGTDDDERIFTTKNDSGNNRTMENIVNATLESSELNPQDLNDTLKRNKYSGGNSNDDRNGWVTLDAIPWSKSKISKWQANPSSQRPWPEIKPWEKPNSGKPWDSEYSSRPSYTNNEPWYDTQKPYRPEYQKDRPTSSTPSRPSYVVDRYDENPSHAQKWPPERPASSWEKFPSSDSYGPNTDIITDDRPSNFPNSWDKYGQTSNKPTHSYNDNRDRFPMNNNNNNNNNNKYNQNNNYHQNNNNNNKHQQQSEQHDWRDQQNDYPSKFDLMKDKPTIFWGPNSDKGHREPSTRPSSSHYQYNPDHPPNHPSTGDGQWVLLSTNHGYSKSRQRSIKFDAINGDSPIVRKLLNVTGPTRTTKQDNDGTIEMMTSRRQVRLTVLPSINGTNTTTSHGGLLEVESTFKTVDQSQKEYEAEKIGRKPIVLRKRPLRQTTSSGRPSNAAVLAAVGAGMLPATMAMMLPMMLGRKKRSIDVIEPIFEDTRIQDFFLRSSERGDNFEKKKNINLRRYKIM